MIWNTCTCNGSVEKNTYTFSVSANMRKCYRFSALNQIPFDLYFHDFSHIFHVLSNHNKKHDCSTQVPKHKGFLNGFNTASLLSENGGLIYCLIPSFIPSSVTPRPSLFCTSPAVVLSTCLGPGAEWSSCRGKNVKETVKMGMNK